MPTESPTQTFIVTAPSLGRVEDDVRPLWVLRDLLGSTGPQFGSASTLQGMHQPLNGKAFDPSPRRSGAVPTDEVTTIEGLAGTVNTELHPVQEAWIGHDVTQCRYCQPGRIMAATPSSRTCSPLAGSPSPTRTSTGSTTSVADPTCPRIRDAIRAAAATMAGQPVSIRTTTETG